MSKRITYLTALTASVLLSSISALAQDTVEAQKALWDKQCKKCHAVDGSGKSEKGEWLSVAKALKLEKPEVLSVTSADAKKLTDEQITKAMTDGKGKMKGMKDKLSESDLKALVAYVRHLQTAAK